MPISRKKSSQCFMFKHQWALTVNYGTKHSVCTIHKLSPKCTVSLTWGLKLVENFTELPRGEKRKIRNVSDELSQLLDLTAVDPHVGFFTGNEGRHSFTAKIPSKQTYRRLYTCISFYILKFVLCPLCRFATTKYERTVCSGQVAAAFLFSAL